MIKEGNGKENISIIVALYDDWPKYKKNDYLILPPCGACRHNLSKFGNPWVIVSKTKKAKLKELYPLPFKG
jgi:cytidine deaminase